MATSISHEVGDALSEVHIDAAGWSSLEARRAHNPEVIGSNPIPATIGPVAQLVRAPPCHGGGRGFEPRSGRKTE